MINQRIRRTNRSLSSAVVVMAMALVGALTACSPPVATSSSRCAVGLNTISCSYRTLRVGSDSRAVHYQTPLGEAPEGGWPVAIMFQGTGFSPLFTWAMIDGAPFGGFHQTEVVKELLDRGYAVLTPETQLNGFTFWSTNNPLMADYWNTADHRFMLAIFDAIDDGRFGDLSSDDWFAAGISSGGYMTSRMALAYPGRFKALAIAAGSYATCVGPICNVDYIPADHPPTLFLHGLLDPIVPLFTMDAYYERLNQSGVQTRRVVENLAGHRWISTSPSEVRRWFDRFR